MRLIATDPAFSWTGTIFILGLAGIAGLALGLIRGARVTGRRSAWMIMLLPCLLLFVGPGFPFFPAFLVGGFALGNRGPRWLRMSCLVPALSGLLFLLPLDNAGLDHVSPFITLGGFIVLAAGVAFGGSQLFRRWPSRAGVVRVEHALAA